MNPTFSNFQSWEILPTGAPPHPRRPNNGLRGGPGGPRERRHFLAPVQKPPPSSSLVCGEESGAGVLGSETVATTTPAAGEWELGVAKARAQMTSQVSLGVDTKDSFYGSLSGKQVEAELRSLGQILKGLLHDFSSVKSLIQNIEGQSSKVMQRVESLEGGAIAKLKLAAEIADGRILGLVGQADLLDARLSAAEESSGKDESLLRRVGSLEERITACENVGVSAAAAISAAASVSAAASISTPMSVAAVDCIAFDQVLPHVRPLHVCTNSASEVLLKPSSPGASPDASVSDLAQIFVEDVENLSTDSLAEVRRLRNELETPRICILSPDELQSADSKLLLKMLAKSLTDKLGKAASFICVGTQGAQQTFAEHLGANAKAYVLRPHGETNELSAFENCTSISAGRDLKQLMAILPRVGDVFLTVEGGPSLSSAARAAAAAGAVLFPLTRTGGASAGHYGFPAAAISRQVIVHGRSSSWAEITDSSSSIEGTAHVVATAMASLLELNGF